MMLYEAQHGSLELVRSEVVEYDVAGGTAVDRGSHARTERTAARFAKSLTPSARARQAPRGRG